MDTCPPPGHPKASIVIPAWNAWDRTRACLEALRSTTAPRDEVIVVDNGSSDATPTGLGSFGWVKVIRNEANRGFAAACNQGEAAASGEVVVFLNNDTVPVGRWFSELLGPFSDPGVAAAGPRSNFVSGEQLVPGAAYTKMSELRSFERRWREGHAGQTSDTGRLVGFCLAVRRSAFSGIGGFDEGYGIGGYEDDDLCRRLVGAGWRLVVAHGSYLHHVGHATFDANALDWAGIETANRRRFLTAASAPSGGEAPAPGQFLPTVPEQPLVSACLIARDEQSSIGRCLASLSGLVDEIVVGDTGSTDATVEVATAAGAKVVALSWEDHFARARNAALQHCRGRWILWIDADEEWTGDSAALRRYLLADPPADAALVSITNLMGHGVESKTTHPAARVFRRGLRFEGRVHEQVVRPDGAAVVAPPFEGATILHHGYEDEVLARRDKLERNLHLSRKALEEATDPTGVGRAEVDLGRSLLATGRASEALAHLEAAAGSPEPATARMALHVGALAAMTASDLDRAAGLVARLRACSANPLLPDLLTAQLAYAARLYQEALGLFGRLELPGTDQDHFFHRRSEITHMVAACHRALGRADLAAADILATLREEGISREHIGVVVHDAKVAGTDLAEVGRALPGRALEAFLAQLLQLDPDDALAVMEGAWYSHPGNMAILAAAGTLSPRAHPRAVIVWAGRLRERGLGPCPLLSIAADPTRSVPERTLAAAAAKAGFSDPEGDAALGAILAGATGAELEAVRPILEALAPERLGALREAAPSISPARPRLAASIVVPCWNRAPWTLRCLQSLQSTMPDGSYELVIVDNGSTDATSQVTDNPAAGVRVVRNQVNLGFAVACNQGAAAASAEVVVFCNNDVVAKEGWFLPLLAALDDPRVGVVGPKLIFPDGSIQHAGVGLLYDADGEGYLDGFHLLYRQAAAHPVANRAAELRAVTGAVMAVRREAFLELGAFDEGYWNGNEDVDLCLRFGEAGFLVRYEPASVLVHQESASGTERFRETARNRQRLTRRWAGRVIDERERQGVVVAAPFGRGDRPDEEGRWLVDAADAAGVPVVTRSWPRRYVTSFRHRLGPAQGIVLSPLSGDQLDAGMQADLSWLPADARVLAGAEAMAAAGANGGDPTSALVELCGRKKPGGYSSWRLARADLRSTP